MKQISTLLVMLIVAISIHAQSSFFQQVSYRGAFAPAPTSMWTNSWTNWDPQNAAYGSATVTISGDITANRTLDRDTVYLLSGTVFVKNNATLTIESGTVIRGNAAVANSALIVTKGSKLNALGTAAAPVVFTSSKTAGTRAPGDWGGIILLGSATINVPGGVANIEGLTATADTQFGGGGAPNNDDNSGTLTYVRIEFGGYDFATDNEINGLTMGGVGRGTTINHVQVSFNDDDAFEWFGGTVNCSHLVAYRAVDDNWDTDFGFSGSVQFALGVRDPNLSDLSSGSSSEGFESDNDAGGSSNAPKTAAVFSNVTEIGPFRGTGAYPAGQDFLRGARIRRNSELKIFNSIITDYPTGLHLDGAAVISNVRNNLTKVKNNIFGAYTTALTTASSTLKDSLFSSSVFKNDSLISATAADDLLATPYNFTAPDYRPTATLAQSGAEFNDAAFTGRLQSTSANFVVPTTYRGAFAPSPAVPWTEGWVNWDPNSTVYGATTVTLSGSITSNRVLDRDTVYLLSGTVYVKNNATLTIESGTVVRGDASVANSALIVTRGSKLNALGTAAAPVVFTSSKTEGTRNPGDWGGIIILGNSIINVPGGVANIEGLTATADTQFGGSDSLDNSGTLTYVRIEFGGYDFATDNEINGLTMGGVGRGTTINHVQVSFNDDDAFEWFGGTVNCSHLIAYRAVDDNWDTDFGFRGIVQFTLGVRDPNLSDLSASSSSEGFESDNDASGSNNTPKTGAIFTNVTEIGPFRGTGAFPGGQDFVRGARIRRNSELKIFNSIITDYPRAMTINEATVLTNFRTNKAKLENNIFGAYTTTLFDGLNAGTISLRDSLFNTVYKNDSVASVTAADDLLATPYNFTAPDYRPTAVLAKTGASFEDEVFTGVVSSCPVLAIGDMTGNSNTYNCVGNLVYSIEAVPNADTYIWTVPAGFTIVSGQGTPVLTVTVNNATFVSGTVSVLASASCGTQATATLEVTDTKLGAVATPVSNYTNVCSIIGTSTTATISIPVVAGASSYSWSVPAGAQIVSGQGTRTIQVKFNTSALSYTITATASSACATSSKALVVKAAAPAKGIIKTWNGSTDVTPVINACPYFSDPADLESDIVQYTVRQDSVTTGFTWTVSNPATMEIVGSANDTIVSVKFKNSFAFGVLTIAKASGCGSASTSLTVKKLVPAKPGKLITLRNGTTPSPYVNVCDVVGSATEFVRYQLPSVPAYSTSYNWEVVNGGAAGSMTIVGGGTSSDNYVDVRYGAGFTFGSVKVNSQNSCGVSAFNTLTVKSTIPVFPSLTTINGATSGGTLCGSNNIVLTTSAVATDSTANDYIWVLPTGVTPNASIATTNLGSVTGGTKYATASNSIAIDWGSGTKSGKITVAGRSNCGEGKAISLTLVATPAVPGTITASTVCPVPATGGAEYDLTIDAVPGVSAPTPYIWKAPTGLSIISGQGTTTVRVKVTGTPLSTANVSVASDNGCGTSLSRTISYETITAAADCPGTVVGRSGSGFSETESNIVSIATVKLIPNPNKGQFTLMIKSTNLVDKANVQVIDAFGRLISTRVVGNNNGTILANIDDLNLVTGAYIVKYTIGTETGTVKMIVQK